jgi:hypothetical protein
MPGSPPLGRDDKVRRHIPRREYALGLTPGDVGAKLKGPKFKGSHMANKMINAVRLQVILGTVNELDMAHPD